MAKQKKQLRGGRGQGNPTFFPKPVTFKSNNNWSSILCSKRFTILQVLWYRLTYYGIYFLGTFYTLACRFVVFKVHDNFIWINKLQLLWKEESLLLHSLFFRFVRLKTGWALPSESSNLSQHQTLRQVMYHFLLTDPWEQVEKAAHVSSLPTVG